MWRAVHRHHFQHHTTSQDIILYFQFDNSMYCHIISLNFGFLPALWQWWKGKVIVFVYSNDDVVYYNDVYFLFWNILCFKCILFWIGEPFYLGYAFARCVFSTTGWDHSTNKLNCASIGKISTLHYDFDHILQCGHHRGVERKFSLTSNASNVTISSKNIYWHIGQISVHAKTTKSG